MRAHTKVAAAAATVLALAGGCGTQIPEDGATLAPPSTADAGADGASPGDERDGAAPGGPIDGGGDTPPAPCGHALTDGRPIVFVTSATSTGVAVADTSKSGTPVFDERCDDIARDAGFSGTFKAWIQGPAVDTPAVRIGTSQKGWARPDGTVAFTGSSPAAGAPVAPVNVTEKCTTITDGAGAWTGVPTNVVPLSCGDWNDPNNDGTFGDPTKTDTTWQAKGTSACTELRHLYCFQTSN